MILRPKIPTIPGNKSENADILTVSKKQAFLRLLLSRLTPLVDRPRADLRATTAPRKYARETSGSQRTLKYKSQPTIALFTSVIERVLKFRVRAY